MLYYLHSLTFMISMLYQGGSSFLAHYVWLYLWFIAENTMAILTMGCGGKPHGFWCAPLAPNFVSMITYCRMHVVENKWLQRHLLHHILGQANDYLCRFHEWNNDPLSGCHVTTCFYWFMLPCFADFSLYMGRFVWKVGHEWKIPIGSMILPFFHEVCFRRNNGQPMIAKLHLFPSCGGSYLES